MRKFRFALIGLPVSLMLVLLVFPAAVSAAGSGTIAGLGNLTVAYIATPGEVISGQTINATGYDIGIYVGPGVDNVKITDCTVTGANDQGILVQDASNVVISGGTVSGNSIANANISDTWPTGAPPPAPQSNAEVKGIVLAGATNCLVTGVTVKNNLDGGISVLDDGTNHVYSPASATTYFNRPGTGNVVTLNTVEDNLNGCGIVVSAKNPGAGLNGNVVSDNTVLGFDPPGDVQPGVGGIVVAGGTFGSVKITGTQVIGNTADGGFIPGISLHGSSTAEISGTQIVGNVLSNNGGGTGGAPGSGDTRGIEIAGAPGVVNGTAIHSDTVSNDTFGVWILNAQGTSIVNLQTDNVTTPVGP